MKKLATVLAVGAAIMIVGSSALALSPPVERKSLSERVALATHVVVAVGKEVRVIRGPAAARVEPTPDRLELDTGAEIELQVTEVLYPKSFKPTSTLLYRFGGGLFSVTNIRKDVTKGKNIYLLIADQDNGHIIFGPSYGWHLFEPMEALEEVKEAIRNLKESKE